MKKVSNFKQNIRVDSSATQRRLDKKTATTHPVGEANQNEEDKLIADSLILMKRLREEPEVQNLIKNNQVSIEELHYAIYKRLNKKNLMLVAALKLLNHRGQDPALYYISKEDWAVQTYLLFPLKFCISLKWSVMIDTYKMERIIFTLKEQGNIRGNSSQGFKLTQSGIKGGKQYSENLSSVIFGTQREKKSAEKDLILTKFERKILSRFNQNRYFIGWDEIQLPVELSMDEIADIIGISATSSPLKFGSIIINLIQKEGVLSSPVPGYEKARKFLTIQSLFHKKTLKLSGFSKLLSKTVKELNLEETANKIPAL